MSDRLSATIMFLITLVIIAIGIYVMFFANCSDLLWMPISGLPSRCITKYTPVIMNL